KIIQMLRLPNGLMKILVEGESQAFIKKLRTTGEYLEADIDVVADATPDDRLERKMQALLRQCADLFLEYITLHRTLPQELQVAFDNITDPVRKLYFVAANLTGKIEMKQSILDISDLHKQ